MNMYMYIPHTNLYLFAPGYAKKLPARTYAQYLFLNIYIYVCKYVYIYINIYVHICVCVDVSNPKFIIIHFATHQVKQEKSNQKSNMDVRSRCLPGDAPIPSGCTLQETNISHLGKRKIIFKYALSWLFFIAQSGVE